MIPNIDIRPMLNAYPDSLGGNLSSIGEFLSDAKVKGAFSTFYILPSMFHSDLDRGFSVIDYELEESMTTMDDLRTLRSLGIDLKLDFVLNHLSVNSPQFQSMVNDPNSSFKDFFIDWNAFWDGKGKMTNEGYIQPDPEWISSMFFRKPGLPILMVRFPDGREIPYWNTFYQEVKEENGHRTYLGQMDLNIRSPKVLDFYRSTLKKLAEYGANIVRLDAFAYAAKEAGKKNFFNEPETWDLLEWLCQEAEPYGIRLLPEIHDSYETGMYQKVAKKGYMIYDFFLPGLMIDAIESKDPSRLAVWAREVQEKDLKTVNMLGCHDGIPLLDLKGILSEERIQSLIDLILSRGGLIKNLHGQKNVYYQVNATYFSALGADPKKMELARAIQMFLPGKPQVWYLDLLEGENDLPAVARGGSAGHKEINRTNLSKEQISQALNKPSVQKQLQLLKLRNTHPAFTSDADIQIGTSGSILQIQWKNENGSISFKADLSTGEYDYA